MATENKGNRSDRDSSVFIKHCLVWKRHWYGGLNDSRGTHHSLLTSAWLATESLPTSDCDPQSPPLLLSSLGKKPAMAPHCQLFDFDFRFQYGCEVNYEVLPLTSEAFLGVPEWLQCCNSLFTLHLCEFLCFWNSILSSLTYGNCSRLYSSLRCSPLEESFPFPATFYKKWNPEILVALVTCIPLYSLQFFIFTHTWYFSLLQADVWYCSGMIMWYCSGMIMPMGSDRKHI